VYVEAIQVRKLKALSFVSMAALLLLAGCATKPKPATEASPSSIQAEATGLAPAGDQRFRSINFAVLFGDSESVASWSLAIVDQRQKTAARTIAGSGGELPDALSWDGKTDAGALAPEGSYAAVLSVDYGNKYGPGKAVSKPFLLDIQPPSGSFSPNPAQFAYAPDGMPKPISVTIAAKPGLAKLASWRLDLFDASGGQVKLLSGAWPANQASWDGKTDSGGYVETAKIYPAVLTLSDEYGNAGTFKGAFSVADVPGAGASAIETRRAGFSPTSTSVKNSLDLLLAVGSKGAAKAWEVQVLGVERGSVKKIRSFTEIGRAHV
jgi:hypothetical protein